MYFPVVLSPKSTLPQSFLAASFLCTHGHIFKPRSALLLLRFPFQRAVKLHLYHLTFLLCSCILLSPLTYIMSSLLKSSQASSEATTPATDAWPDSSASPPDLHKPTLPSFKEILPRSHIESKPPRVVSRPLPLIQPAVKTYQLPFRRAKDDIIKMPYTMIKPENEGIYSMTRKTVHGKTLTYTLTVRQQPERARACGAGARGEMSRSMFCTTSSG